MAFDVTKSIKKRSSSKILSQLDTKEKTNIKKYQLSSQLIFQLQLLGFVLEDDDYDERQKKSIPNFGTEMMLFMVFTVSYYYELVIVSYEVCRMVKC